MSSSAKKILIIDEEEDITILTGKFLQLENYDVITCSNSYDALSIIEEKHEEIALVLLDIMFHSGKDGYEILTEIKSRFPKILVVLFSVKNFFEDIQKGKELGADGYLVKSATDLAKFFKRGDNDDDRYPYPYVFKPPSPPDDFASAAQGQLPHPPKKEILEKRICCQYCGREVTKEEQLNHSCKEKPKNT